MKKDILIIANFTQVPSEPGNGRFHYLAQLINKKRASVEIVTSDFSHRRKAHRNLCTEEESRRAGYRFTMIHEPGYKKNISLKRYLSHHMMGKNLKEYLEKRAKPDVIYCAVPPPSVAKVAAQYAKKNDIPFIIDVQDIWPDAYKMFFHMPPVSDWLFRPVEKVANYVYRAADYVVAVSRTYADRVLAVNEKCSHPKVVFLGTELKVFDEHVEDYAIDKSGKKELWLAYVGSLSYSYNIPLVVDALAILQKRGINDIKFVVIGDGPLASEYQKYAEDKDVWVEFTGRLDYGKMAALLSACDIAVNPIKKGSGGSIINKHADYAAAGLPVLNTQENVEYRELVEQWNMGFNCKNSDPSDLADKLMMLYKNRDLRESKGYNSRKLAESLFDRAKTYPALARLLES